jgi:streptogramin lyase
LLLFAAFGYNCFSLQGNLKMKTRIISVLAISLSLITTFGCITAARAFAPAEIRSSVQANASFQEYAVAGNPTFVTLESPNSLWFSLPYQNAIGQILLANDVVTTNVYAIPTTNAQPYRITFAAGAVWFTERSGNNIGRLDPQTGTVSEFAVPTAGVQPSGIAALAGNPTTIWFTEDLTGTTGNGLARLVVTDTLDFAFTEFPLGIDSPGQRDLQPEAIQIENSDSIWFTAPGVSQIYRFTPSRWPGTAYAGVSPCPMFGCGSSPAHPWSITFGPGANGSRTVYTTDPAGNRILRLDLNTLQAATAFSLPSSNSGPYEIVGNGNILWFSERNVSRAGRLRFIGSNPSLPGAGVIAEFALPGGSAPEGLGVDQNGCIWIAESSHSRIAHLCLSDIYLPLIMR